jgi:hypothetical protein
MGFDLILPTPDLKVIRKKKIIFLETWYVLQKRPKKIHPFLGESLIPSRVEWTNAVAMKFSNFHLPLSTELVLVVVPKPTQPKSWNAAIMRKVMLEVLDHVNFADKANLTVIFIFYICTHNHIYIVF